MFKKILIANRGEIACRVIRTAHKMDIKTVAVYSDADRDSLHVSMADEAVHVGTAPAAESYLVVDRIIQACRDTGAEAVHPGYGFLAENAEFSRRLSEAGIIFIGPDPRAICSMGDKIKSKRLAVEAGVDTIPGHAKDVPDAERAVAVAREIGYPVMLKATAGGGGKGMRVAHNDDDCRDGFARAASEAQASFGDNRVFVEKFVVDPRHIEIQVLADNHGNVIHLGERECSLQRRHQKVIEEAPSPLLDDATREAMGRQAVSLARAVDYRSAGTVEFLVDAERNFYFLEMNTRLQVEHPVTEIVTGLDLVEWMIRIAAGETLHLPQSDVRLNGWAIEARIYAEDPFRGFLPSTGRLVKYVPPRESDVVRVDTGVHEGSEVSMFYDPLIAKVIVKGETREQAVAQMSKALNEFYIRGVAHNIGFLSALVVHPRFREGQLSTGMISEEYPHGFRSTEVVRDDPALLIVVAAAIHRRYMDRAAGISGQLPGYERHVDDRWVVVLGDSHHEVEVRLVEGGQNVFYGGESYHVRGDWRFGQPLFRGTVNGKLVCVQVERIDLKYRLFHSGCQVDVMVMTQRAAELLACMPKKKPPDLSRYLLSPMPGLLAQLAVGKGDEVKSGQHLAIVEAMKMENVLRAERDGRVAKVVAAVGDTLAVDQPILEFE